MRFPDSTRGFAPRHFRHRTAGCILLLGLATALYCHRFYGTHLEVARGDTLQNTYFRLYPDLLAANHNPFQWHYLGYMPFAGANNPVLFVVAHIVDKIAAGASALTRALSVNMITSFLLLWGLAISGYVFFRSLQRSRAASCLGAVVLTFTGMHLVGVREFNHMYLLSFLSVPPALLCFRSLARAPSIAAMAGAALWIGLSLLGGTHTPMFFYLSLVPLMAFLPSPGKLSDCLRRVAWQCSAIALGILAGAATLIPGLASITETNRAGNDFRGEPFTLAQKIATLFLRDWWRNWGTHFHESDYFLGLPVVILAAAGMWSLGRESRKSVARDPLVGFLGACLIAGAIISHHYFLPSGVSWLLSQFFSRLSIHNPHRLFLLCLLPLAYFSALGLDSLTRARAAALTLAAVALASGLVVSVLLPNLENVHPHQGMASSLSLISAAAATLCFLLNSFRKSVGWGVGGIFLTYGMYLYAPLQSTMYATALGKLPDPDFPHEKLPLRVALGLSSHYSDVVARVRPRFEEPVGSLRMPATREGKVLDFTELRVKARQHYFAPHTGHRFALSLSHDAATPRYVRELAWVATDAILNMSGACWATAPPYDLLISRPACFPEAILVNGALSFSNNHELLLALPRASTADFRRQVYVACTGAKCPALPSPSSMEPQGAVTIEHSRPGALRFKSRSSAPAVLFTSVTYHPAWEAKVNGERVAVTRANHAFLALPVPAGAAVVELHLDQSARRLSLILSALTFAGLGITLLLPTAQREWAVASRGRGRTA